MSESEMLDELLADARERMAKSVESMRHEFGSVRTGRASPALLDRISVDYYGAFTPLKQLVKVVRHIAEEGRVAIRNIRRDVMHDLRELKEAGETGRDEEHRAELELQKVTDGRIAELDEALKQKEEEILEV